MKNNIAALFTCHNRVTETLDCLNMLFNCTLPDCINKLDVFLVDDGSTDKTTEKIQEQFPNITIIQGNGNLFWNQGMRKSWITASKEEYDFYLLLNDDIQLFKNSILSLFNAYKEAIKLNSKGVLITGAFKNNDTTNEFSYGGRNKNNENVIPNGNIQPCVYVNGNALLVSKEIYHVLGVLAIEYTHAMGDFDYGLRAIKNGFKNYTTKKYIGVCAINKNAENWANPKLSLKRRHQLFTSPRGLNIKEYTLFRKKFWKKSWPIFVIKAYLKLLFPKGYKFLKNE